MILLRKKIKKKRKATAERESNEFCKTNERADTEKMGGHDLR